MNLPGARRSEGTGDHRDGEGGGDKGSRIKVIERDGWILVRTRGSHQQFAHPVKPETVTVSGKAGVDVPPGTLNSVLKQADLKQPGRTP